MISVYEHPKIEYISLIKKMVFVGDQEKYTSLVTLFVFLVIKQILI